jgi:peptidoglycan hydrolase CwlO-like protein
MKINKTYILLAIVGGIAVYSIFQNASIKTDVAGYYRKIDSLQREIDSVEVVNQQIDNHITEVTNEITNVENRVVKINNNINEIKNQTHEKVSAVNDYTIHDLIKFFSDRYESNVGEAGHDSTSKATDSKVSH